MTQPATPPVAMTIAGTDSGGSAGLAADLKTFARHGVHGVFAITVATAQNTTGIASVHQLPAAFVGSQIDTVTADLSVVATKTGLLFSPEVLATVVERADTLGSLVVDPVLVTGAGVAMLAPEMTELYLECLLPLAAVLTPNVAEASLLSGVEVTDRASAIRAAEFLGSLGSAAVVITGLLEADAAVDIIALDGAVDAVDHVRVDTTNVLGTGCSLSAAITAFLAQGMAVRPAIDAAIEFVVCGLESSADWALGAGSGPIDHFARPVVENSGR